MAQVLNNYSSNASVASSSSSISENIAQYRNAWFKRDQQGVQNIATELATQFKQKGYKPGNDFLSPVDLVQKTSQFPDKMNNWLKDVEAQEQFSSNDSAATESVSDQSDNQTQSTASTQKSFAQSVHELNNIIHAADNKIVPAAVLEQTLRDVVNSVEPEEKKLAAEKATEIYRAAVVEKNKSKVLALENSLLDLNPARMKEGEEVAGLPPIAPLGILASEAQDRQSFVPANNRISSSQSVGIPRNNNRISSNSSTVTAPYRLDLPSTRSVNLNIPSRSQPLSNNNNNNRFRSSNSVYTTSDESKAVPLDTQHQLDHLFAEGGSVYSYNNKKNSSNNSVYTSSDSSISNESARNRINSMLNDINALNDTNSVVSQASRFLQHQQAKGPSSVISTGTHHTTTSWIDDNQSQASRSSTATLQLAKARQEMESKAKETELVAQAFQKSQQLIVDLENQLQLAQQELTRKDEWIQKLDGNIEDLKFDTKDLQQQYNEALRQRDQQQDILIDQLNGLEQTLEEAKSYAYEQNNIINEQTEFKNKLTGMLTERTIKAEQLQNELQIAIDELVAVKNNNIGLTERLKQMEIQHHNTLDMIDKSVNQKYITREEAALAQAEADKVLDQYKLNLTNAVNQYNKLKAQVDASKEQKSTELDLKQQRIEHLEAEQNRITAEYQLRLKQGLESQQRRIESSWEQEKGRLLDDINRLTREKQTAVTEKDDIATKSERLQKQLNERLREERKLREDSDNKLASLEVEMVELANKEKKALLKIASLEKRPQQPNNNNSAQDAEISELQEEIRAHQAKYDTLERSYKKESEAVALHAAEEAKLYNTIQELQDQLQEFEEANITVKGYRALQRRTQTDQVDIKDLQRKLKESKEDAFEKDQQITQLQDALTEARRSKPSRPLNNDSFIDYKSQLDAKTEELEKLHKQYLALLRTPSARRTQPRQPAVADDSKELLEEAQTKIDQLRTQIASLEGDLTIVTSALKMRDSTILTLNATIDADQTHSFDQAVKVYKDQLKAKDAQIQQLAEEVRNKDILLAAASGGDDGDDRKYNNNMVIDSSGSGRQPTNNNSNASTFATYQPSLANFTNASSWDQLVQDFIDLWHKHYGLQQQYSLLQGQNNNLQQQLDMVQRIHSNNPDLAQLQQDLKEAIDDKERWKRASVEASEKNKRLKDQLKAAVTNGSQPPLPPNNNNFSVSSDQDLVRTLTNKITRLEDQLRQKNHKAKPNLPSFNIATGSSDSHAVQRFLAVVASVY